MIPFSRYRITEWWPKPKSFFGIGMQFVSLLPKWARACKTQIKKIEVNEGLTNSKFGSRCAQTFPLSYLMIANRSMKASLLYPYREESGGCWESAEVLAAALRIVWVARRYWYWMIGQLVCSQMDSYSIKFSQSRRNNDPSDLVFFLGPFFWFRSIWDH